MSIWLMAVVTAIYIVVCIDLLRKGDRMALAYAGWALANVGIIWSMSK